MRRIGPGLVALMLLGCGDAAPPGGATGVETVDSAGVAITTSPASDAVYAEVAPEPTLSIGVRDGPEELMFAGIITVARDRAGNLVVADNGAGEIRIFDADGAHVRSFGGRGEGPGEFEALAGAWPTADGAIVAADRRLQRMTRFDSQGALLGTGALSGLGDMDMLTPVGPVGSETFVSKVRSLTPPSTDNPIRSVEEAFAGDVGPPEQFMLYRLDGTLVDTLAEHPGLMMSASTSGNSISLLRVPFSPEPAATGSDRGAAVTGGRAYEVGIFDQTGRLGRIVRLDEAPERLTDEHLEAYVRGTSGPSAADDASIRQMVAMYREMSLPERMPAYTDLRIADDGQLWALRYRVRGGPATARWDVFADDGRHLGHVAMPSGFALHAVAGGQAIGAHHGELGVERVEVRELVVSGG